MDKHVQHALEAGLRAYAGVTDHPIADVLARLITVFDGEIPYLEKVTQLDVVFDDNPRLEELREIAFDLLLMNFFAADVEKLENDYLESEEWESIEEQTIDRGTELLNLLLYFRECTDEDIRPHLDDYLKEFLLVDEDEFQDEHRIYEPVIANQLLLDSSYGEIGKVAANIPANQELTELFFPIMSFFYEQHPTASDLEEYTRSSANPAFDTAVYALLVAYNH